MKAPDIDASEVLEILSQQVAQLIKQNAILTAQLTAALKEEDKEEQ